MKLNKMVRFSSLLLALGLLLGLAVTGCSEKDRDKNSDTPVVTDKAFSFVFQVGGTASTTPAPTVVQGTPDTVRVLALDEELEVIKDGVEMIPAEGAVATSEAKLANLHKDVTTGVYDVDTAIDGDAYYCMYLFTHTDEYGDVILDSAYTIEMSKVAADETVYADKVEEILPEDIEYIITDDSGNELESVAPGKEFIVNIAIKYGTDRIDVNSFVDVISHYSDAIVEKTGTTDGKHHFQVKPTADDGEYDMSVMYSDIYVTWFTVKVNSGE